MNRTFVSGLPGPDLRPREKSFEQVVVIESRRAILERRKRDERKRLYAARLTEEVKRATDRMIGDSDE